MKNNIYILTEERIKISVIEKILNIYIRDNNSDHEFVGNISLKPIFNDKIFCNYYEIENCKINNINKIYSLIVSGTTSFVDHLIFEQDSKPTDYSLKSKNIKYAFEDTKTDSTESRNTVFGQRGSKHVILSYYNNHIPYKVIITDSILSYNDKEDESGLKIKGFPPSSKFDARCLVTSDVEVIGIENFDAKPFKNFKELKETKNNMKMPPKNNIPFRINTNENFDSIQISKKLLKPVKEKSGGTYFAWSDPSIGQILSTCLAIRNLNYEKKITITKHMLNDKMIVGKENKFLLGCKVLGLNLENIELPNIEFPKQYWRYPNFSDTEKHATILFHHMLNYSKSDIKVIFDNHGGCARSYLITINNNNFSIPKQTPDSKLPDIILADHQEKIIYMIEGKTHSEYEKGLEQIQLYETFYKKYIIEKCEYKDYELENWIILSGNSSLKVNFEKVLFNLKEDFSLDISPHINKKLKDIFKFFF